MGNESFLFAKALRIPFGRRAPGFYLLVHGFNNDRAQAQASYGAFRDRIGDLVDLHTLQRVWEFYWPGYEDAIAEPLGECWKASARRVLVGQIDYSEHCATFRQIYAARPSRR